MLSLTGFILGTGLSACGNKKTDESGESTEYPAEESEHPSEHPTENKEHPSN